MFLCRGKRCRHPQILPHAHRAVADYTLYDWLARWDITYENAGRPRSRDFPIRIAGYLNRLREIYNRLHCRACATLMVPHMDYARTSYKSLSDGVVRVEQLAAAYRLTVFHCNDAACAEHGKNYYINHCLGFNCREIIDSRDLKNKCAAGRYVCNACGSCCQEHGSQSRQASDTRSLSHGVTGRPHAAATARPSEALSGVRTAGVDNIRNTGYEPVRQARAALTLDEILNVAWPEARDR